MTDNEDTWPAFILTAVSLTAIAAACIAVLWAVSRS